MNRIVSIFERICSKLPPFEIGRTRSLKTLRSQQYFMGYLNITLSNALQRRHESGPIPSRPPSSPTNSPDFVQNALPNFPAPMMTSLMYNGTHLSTLCILPIIKNTPHSQLQVLLQQHPPPPPCPPNTPPPPSHLPLIILTSPSLEKATIPLEPAPDIVFMVNPPSCLPLFDALAACDFVLVYFRVISWVSQVFVDIKTRDPETR